MQPQDLRESLRQLAADFLWLEEHCRQQEDLAAHGGQLRFAAALTRNVISPRIEGLTAPPLHLAVVGGAGAGKSTIINLLAGAHVATANPQAGYTRHPTAYRPAASDQPWPGYHGYLGSLRRLADDFPADLDKDVYQVRTRPDPVGADPLKDFVLWDCPDMTTWAATSYVTRLVEVTALADVIVYVASDERYNDEIPTEFLHVLIRAGKAVVVCLTKMRDQNAADMADHFREDVLARLQSPDSKHGIPQVPVITFPHLPAESRADFQGAAATYRANLINQILVLCPDAEQARSRTVQNAERYLHIAGESLLQVARKDIASIEEWKASVERGRLTFEERYREEYLSGEPFLRFDRVKEQTLAMFELPATVRYLSAVFSMIRMPYVFLRDQFLKLTTRPSIAPRTESEVLQSAYRAWIEGLQAEALRQAGKHPVWRQIAKRFEGSLKHEAHEQFQSLARAFALKESDELERAARQIPEWFAERPIPLAMIRFGKIVAEAAMVVLILVVFWIPSWYHILMIPLAVGLVHQLFEWVVGWWIAVVRQRARQQRERLLNDQLSQPLATWHSEQPFAGGSSVEQLRQVIARVPMLIRSITQALSPTQPETTAS